MNQLYNLNFIVKSKFRVLVCFLIILSGCGSKEIRHERRTGINGDATYVYNPDGTVRSMFKDSSVKGFVVFLANDSIALGDTLKSSILVTSPSYKIKITYPEPREFVSSADHKSNIYTFLPKKEGVYDYRGTIEFDSTVAQFEYKFIVIEK